VKLISDTFFIYRKVYTRYVSSRYFGHENVLSYYRHYGVHVHDPKCIYTGKFIGVWRDEFKLYDVTMLTDDIIKRYKSMSHANF